MEEHLAVWIYWSVGCEVL